MGAYDRPDEETAIPTHVRAWDEGYKAAEAGEFPSMGGLFRGEEEYYINGFNRSSVERGRPTYYLQRHPEGGWRPVQDRKPNPEEVPNLPGGEVRTTSSTGGQKGVKPERYSLVPVEPLASVARLYAFGVKKYAAHNWRLGYEWSKSYDSLFRHANASMNGEDYDPETGEPHLAGVVFHAFALMEYLFHPERYAIHDDRYKPEPIESAEEKIVTTLVNAHVLTEEEAVERFSEGRTAQRMMQEYQGVVHTPIDQMIDYLAGMYENWSITTAKELRRVANDLRNDKNRNVKVFGTFREEFPTSRITGLQNMKLVATHLTEIEPMIPKYDARTGMLEIPAVVGAVYYANDKHVIGKYRINSPAEVEALALPGYRFPEGADTSWLFLA